MPQPLHVTKWNSSSRDYDTTPCGGVNCERCAANQARMVKSTHPQTGASCLVRYTDVKAV